MSISFEIVDSFYVVSNKGSQPYSITDKVWIKNTWPAKTIDNIEIRKSKRYRSLK